MNIRVKKDGVGECNITTSEEIPIEYQYAIKGLAGLQLMFMNNDPSYREHLSKILQELATLTSHIGVEESVDDPVERFFQ